MYYKLGMFSFVAFSIFGIIFKYMISRKYFVSAILVFAFVASGAQIVNIESSRMQSDTTGWMGRAGASVSFIKNVAEILLVDVDVHLQYKTQKDLWLILADYGFLRGGGEKFISNSFAHLRYNRKYSALLRWEWFGQAQSNFVTRIDSRFLLGTGPRFKICSTHAFRLYAASLVMYEHEKELGKPAFIHNDLRSSSYISFTIVPNDIVEIISTTFYQPLLKKFSDFRVLNQVVVRARTGKHFALSMRWNYLHDRKPAFDAPKTTYHFSMGADYEF